MMAAFNIQLDPTPKIDSLVFPDIVHLVPPDRDYDLLKDSYDYARKRNISEDQRPKLQLRSLFYDDLSISAFDEHFMDGGKDRNGYSRRPKTLAGEGAPKVLQAIRTYTQDVELINYRLDVQDDLAQNPSLIPAFETFYGKIIQANNLHYSAFARDSNRNKIRDQWGRWVYASWQNLPTAFSIVDSAMSELEKVLNSTTSRGMQEITQFFSAVRKHPVYAEWHENIHKIVNGGKYFLAFQFDVGDGMTNMIELGMVSDGSPIDILLQTPSTQNGIVNHQLNNELIIRRTHGVVKTELGHLLQASFKLDFETLDQFCNILTTGMHEQLSFYAALGTIYSKYMSYGIPVCRPIVGKGDSGMEMRKTIHPVVAVQAKLDNKKLMFNDYQIYPHQKGILLTGPNDAGKTCSGKAFALNIAMAQAGIQCPAEYVRIGKPVRDILTHFVSKDDIEKGKGRHRNELSRARRICELLTPEDYLLFDEPCGGTDTKSGLQDSWALVRYADQLNIPTVFATHLHELSARVEAGELTGFVNMQAEMILENDEHVLTHRIISGRATESFGSRISNEERVTVAALDELIARRIAAGELDDKLIRR